MALSRSASGDARSSLLTCMFPFRSLYYNVPSNLQKGLTFDSYHGTLSLKEKHSNTPITFHIFIEKLLEYLRYIYKFIMKQPKNHSLSNSLLGNLCNNLSNAMFTFIQNLCQNGRGVSLFGFSYYYAYSRYAVQPCYVTQKRRT